MEALEGMSIPYRDRVLERDRRRRLRSDGSILSLRLVAGIVALGIIALVLTVVVKGLPAMSWEFVSQGPRDGMKAGGIWPMIRGSILLMVGTMLLVLPMGILGGVFLAEYCGRSRFYQFIHAAVTALAGTPSIVFGLFGLAVFVLTLQWKFCLLAGWLTLAIFAMPTIVLTTENSIKSVPDSLVEGALSLGLSKWQALRKVVLPNAMPGILSGIILATGRVAGEAPPILLSAGIYYSTTPFAINKDLLFRPVENLPYHLAEGYRQGGVIPDKVIWGTCLCLLVFVFAINMGAIVLRSRMRWKQQL